MAEVEIRRNELSDAALARRFEAEVAEAARPAAEPFACAILDEGLHVEIEVERPGWTETVRIPFPVRPGEVTRALRRTLAEIGLLDGAAAGDSGLRRVS